MKRLTLTALTTVLYFSHSAFANPQLAKANNCFACHSLDKKIIGPSFRDIAKKYSGQLGAENKMMDKIRRGSVGVWGSTPMQPMPDISDEDLRTLSKWMLAQ